MRRWKPEILHAHVHEGLAIALLARWAAPGTRVVYDAHGTFADELAVAGLVRYGGRRYRAALALERWLCRHADSVLAQSEHRAAEMVWSRVSADRGRVLADSPEPGLFPVAARAEVRDGMRSTTSSSLCTPVLSMHTRE